MSLSAWFSGLSILLPLIAAIVKLRILTFEFKCFFVFVLLGILCEFLSYYFSFHHYNTSFLLSIYFLIEVEFLVFFLLVNSLSKKNLALAIVLSILVLALWVYLIFFTERLDESISMFKSITSLVISIISGYGLFMLSNNSESSIFINPMFWLQVGILIYFFGTLFVFYTLNWQDSKGSDIANNTVYVHDFLNFVYNLCQATAFWLFRKAKTFTF